MTDVPDELASLMGALARERDSERLDVVLGLLERLGSFPHPTVVLSLAWLLKEPPRGPWWRRLRSADDPPPGAFGAALRDALLGLVGRMSVQSIGELDDRMRRDCWDRSPGTWGGMRGEPDVARLSRGNPTVLALATMHANGHVREAAVRWLSRETGNEALPFLVLRLNDWVSEVRQAAEEAVLSRLRSNLDESVIDSLPLFERLVEQVRARSGAVPALLDERLASERGAALLLGGARSADRAVRRACYRRLVERRGPRLGEAMLAGARDGDLYVRMLCARALTECLDEPEVGTWIEAFARDPYGPVRRDSLRARAKLSLASALPHLRQALWDPSRAVRECAYHFLQGELPRSEIVELYRFRLEDEDGRVVRIAIESIESLGDAQDAPAIGRFLTYPRAAVAVAALRCLNRLDPSASRELLLAHLLDHRTSVVRQAVELLRDFGGPEDECALARALMGDAPGQAKRPLLRLVKRVELWRRLELLLDFPMASAPECLDRVQAELHDWCEEHDHGRQAPRTPRSEALHRARAALGAASEWLSSGACAELRHSLNSHSA